MRVTDCIAAKNCPRDRTIPEFQGKLPARFLRREVRQSPFVRRQTGHEPAHRFTAGACGEEWLGSTHALQRSHGILGGY
jgi:hypothetical protein